MHGVGFSDCLATETEPWQAIDANLGVVWQLLHRTSTREGVPQVRQDRSSREQLQCRSLDGISEAVRFGHEYAEDTVTIAK